MVSTVVLDVVTDRQTDKFLPLLWLEHRSSSPAHVCYVIVEESRRFESNLIIAADPVAE
jgi:hypothetical protein